MIARFLRFESPLLRDLGLLALRLTVALSMMLAHGLGKLQGWDERKDSFADPFGIGPAASLALAIFAEVFCSGLLALGLLTRAALIPLIVTMLVAIFHAHAADPWKTKELAVVYLLSFITLWASGPGRFSADHLVIKK